MIFIVSLLKYLYLVQGSNSHDSILQNHSPHHLCFHTEFLVTIILLLVPIGLHGRWMAAWTVAEAVFVCNC